MRSIAKWGAVLLIAFAVLAPGAFASAVNGTIFLNVPASGDARDPSNYNYSLPYATFTVGAGGIDFNAGWIYPEPFTANGFLNSPVFTGHNGFDPNAPIDNMALLLTGSIYLNAGMNSFQVGHDDGVVLDITGIGTVVNEWWPTALVTTPFNVNAPAAGNYDFTLKYVECCSAPANLIFNINNEPVGQVPEPSALVMMGSSLFGVAWTIRRRLRR